MPQSSAFIALELLDGLGDIVPNFVAAPVSFFLQRSRHPASRSAGSAPITGRQKSRIHFDCFLLSWHPHRQIPHVAVSQKRAKLADNIFKATSGVIVAVE